MEIYTIKDLTFAYPKKSAPALDGICFSINEGEFIALVGPSGCGKTTLLRQLKPTLAPHGIKTGKIIFEDKPLDVLVQREQSEK